MSDFGARRDMRNVSAYSDADAFFEFNFEADAQVVINESNVDFELSFDGQDTHAYLIANTAASVVAYADHVRSKLWVKRASGSGGSAKYIQVLASTR